MIDKKIIKPFAYEIYKKSFQEIDEKTKENAFFLKNKLIVDYYFYEVFNDKHMADDIMYILQKPNTYYTDCSLWYGLAGIGLILKKIDCFDSNEIRNKISLIVSRDVNDLSNCCLLNHRYYDLFFGLIGKGQYLLHEDAYRDQILKILFKIEHMIRNLDILSFKSSELMQKPNFYINRNLRSIYPNGYIDLGMAHGLASILKFLVNCFNQGYNTYQSIVKILGFYEQIIKSERFYLYDKRFDGNSKRVMFKPTWCYGDLGIAISINSAQKCVCMNNFDDYIEYVFKNSISFYQNETFDNDFFCHGKVGCAYLLKNLGFNIVTENEINKVIIQNLEKDNFKYEKRWSVINGLPSLIVPWLDSIVDEKKRCFSEMILL